jgi:hypothetical protein
MLMYRNVDLNAVSFQAKNCTVCGNRIEGLGTLVTNIWSREGRSRVHRHISYLYTLDLVVQDLPSLDLMYLFVVCM